MWHENVVDILAKFNKKSSIICYIDILKNICFADYIDRITFQKQIWLFNEMSSLIKTFYNNEIIHKFIQSNHCSLNKQLVNKSKIYDPEEVRFTKVLTKYSTEYNNQIFLQHLCLEIMIDKKDLIFLFTYLKLQKNLSNIEYLLENYDFTQLDINRMYRYTDKIIECEEVAEQT